MKVIRVLDRFLLLVIIITQFSNQSISQSVTSAEDSLAQPLNYAYLENPERAYDYEEIQLIYANQHFFPRHPETAYLSLGFPGSPAREVLYVPDHTIGFDLGIHQYDVYRLSQQNFKYYHLPNPYTQVQYNQGQGQSNNIFHGKFARDFSDGIQFSLDYTRTNNEGKYQNQKLRNTNIGTGIRYQSPGGKLDLFFTHFANTYEQNHNGGITVDTLNKDAFETPLDIETWLENSNAKSRTHQRSLQSDLFYRFLRSPKDSTTQDTVSQKNYFLFRHQLKYGNDYYKFTDDQAGNSLDYYGSFYSDSRGIRNYFRDRVLSNSLAVRFESTNRKKLIELGSTYKIHWLNHEPEEKQFSELFVHGDIAWFLGNKIDISALGNIHLGDPFEFYFNGRINTVLGDWGNLYGSLSLSQQQSDLTARKLYITQTEIYNKDLNKILTNSIHAGLNLQKIGLSIEVYQHLISNFVYFTPKGSEQDAGSINLIALKIQQENNWGRLLLKNKIILQRQDENSLTRLPSFYSQHGLYYQGPMFGKAMNVLTGVQARYIGERKGMSYSPLLGYFVLEEATQEDYLQFDFIFSFQTKRFLAFVKVIDLGNLFNQSVYYPHNGYPNELFTFRIGIDWIFLN